MSVILNDIKQLWKKEKAFLFQLVLIHVISIFGILFVAGVMINNYMVDRETPFGTLAFSLDFGDNPVKCAELKETVSDMFDKMGLFTGATYGISYINEKGAYDELFCSFSMKNGKYKPINSSDLLEWGRYFSDEDYNSEVPMAVTLNVDSETYIRNGVEYQIIGKKDANVPGYENYVKDNYRQICVQPRAMDDEEISFCSFGVKRILSSKEQKKIVNAFEKVVGGNIKMYYQEENTAEKKAILKSVFISGGLIVFSLIGTLFVMYIYMFSKRRNRLAIWRLVGCSKKSMYVLFLFELYIVVLLSLAVGTILFYLCRFLFLDSIYKYMAFTLTPINVLVVFLLLSFVIFVVSSVLSFSTQSITIKELLRKERGR
ncbi:MAG: ABC transporter permease [Lachnospiraceae bacterium]|nr:ABC transporter permease [Lachnospiraceae bacterium]